jgi:ElaB/YqjD/DUF883 family membrane-anchored ribosome-binding protein
LRIESESRLTLRTLIDTIERKFDDDFKRAKDTMTEDLGKAEGAFTKANKTIESLKGKIEKDRNDPHVEEYQQTIDRLYTQRNSGTTVGAREK